MINHFQNTAVFLRDHYTRNSTSGTIIAVCVCVCVVSCQKEGVVEEFVGYVKDGIMYAPSQNIKIKLMGLLKVLTFLYSAQKFFLGKK